MILENDSPYNKPTTADRRNRINNPTPYSGLGKLPPQAVDLEEAVLGALMLERSAFLFINEFIKEEMFYKDGHQKVYSAIAHLFSKGSPIDILTITSELRRRGELEMIGGAYYITELTNRVASAANIEYHGRIVQQKYIQREIIRINTESINTAYEDTTDVLELLEENQMALFKLSSLNESQQARRIDGLIDEAIAELDKPAVNGLTGIGTGFIALNNLTAGWQNGELTILAARPAMGKSALMMQLARNGAVIHDKAVAVFSLEMPKKGLINRMISNESEIFLSKINKKSLNDVDKGVIGSKLGQLKMAKIHIDDTPALSITAFRSKAIRMKQLYGIELIIIDYLQLMQGNFGGKNGNRDQEIGQITRGLKAVAKELDIPVIALCQLSRAADMNGGAHRPRLSDLRESGNIEQDADNVFFLYRPAYYGLKDKDKNLISEEMAELICAKNRNGETTTLYLRWRGNVMRFDNWVDEPKFEPAQLEIAVPTENFIIKPTPPAEDELPF